MRFCKECGEKLGEQLQFCSNCGTKVDVVDEAITKEKVTQYENVATTENPKKSKRKKIFFIMLAVAAILLFGAYQFGAHYFSKEKQVEAFIHALETKDTKELTSMIEMSDTRVKVTEEDVKSYLRYMDENPSYYQQLMSYLNEQAVDGAVVNEEEKFPDVQVIEQGKKWMLYPIYKLQVQAYYLDIQTNTEGATIYVDDKKTAEMTNEGLEKEIGPYFPGTHRVKAVAETDLTKLESEKEVELADEQDGKVKVKLPLEGHYVSIESDQDDATLYVNGEKRGKLKNGSYKLGPVPTDETIEVYLEKEFDWGVSKTESVKIGTDDMYDLPFPVQVSDSEIEDFVYNHIYDNVRAINLNDFSLIEDDYDRNGKGYKTDRDYLQYLDEKGITEELLQCDVRKVERISESQYKVKTYEEYYIHYSDGSVKFKSFNNESIITVTEDGEILYYSLASNETLKTEDISGPTE